MTTETAHHPYVETTSSIRVSVKPELIRERTAPSQGMYSFAYHVKIENLSDVNVQLIERHWIVMSGGRQIGEVVGPGVIGQQPFLEPGDIFEYSSGTVIHDPVGEMYGSYTFQKETGKFTQVVIPKFDLIFVDYLN